MIHKIYIEAQDGSHFLASRAAYMMTHPGLDDPDLKAGDIIELESGFFVLNDDLNPMKLATEEQIQRARES